MSVTGVYLPRSGEQANVYVDPLLCPPEFPLDAAESAEVFGYENSLFDKPINGAETEETQTVGEILQASIAEDIDSPPFFLKPFLDGRVQAADMPEFASEDEVYGWLVTLAQAGDQEDRLLELSQQAIIAYKAELGAELAAGKSAEDIESAIASARPITTNPEATLQQFGQLQRVREFLRAEYKAIRADEGTWDVVADAKCAILEIYLAKTNGLLANYQPRLGYIQDQAAHIGDHDAWLAASKHLPSWSVQTVMIMRESRRRYLTRLDYLQNGLSYNAAGQPSPISHQLWELASAPAQTENAETIAVFTPEQVQKLKAAKMSPEEMVALYAEVLRRAELLSTGDPVNGQGADRFNARRKARAADGKWQVVKNPNKDSFVVESEPGVVQVPTTPRSVYDALKVGNHELEHVNQGEADAALAAHLKIAGIKGRRVSMLREGGGMITERAAAQAWFGEIPSERPEMDYALAIEALRAGKGPVAAAHAFYKEFRILNPDISPQEAGKRAADRVIRLMRAEHTNSQPMAYSEDALANASLSTPEARTRAMQVVCLDHPDQLRLHKYGLLPLPPRPTQDLGQLLFEAAQPYIDRALSSI